MIDKNNVSSDLRGVAKLFSDEVFLEKELNFFLLKNQIKQIKRNDDLVQSHLQKAKHNFAFYKLNKTQTIFNDWLIVIMYYSLYHCALALIINKGYISKNHYATILVLIKEYDLSKEEVELIDELSITKEDAKLYTTLKEDRHNASYMTNSKFTSDKIEFYEEKIIDFINKTEVIIKNK